MRQCLLSVTLLIGLSSGSAACIDGSTLVRSTVGITREFDAEERRTEPSAAGIRGTGWFLSPRLIVTAAHVSEAMRLSGREWKVIEIRERQRKESRPARIHFVAGSHAEKVTVLELQSSFPDAVALRFRLEPLIPEERLLAIAYPNGELRFATGRFAQLGTDARLAGSALLEMHDGNDRLVLDHGASGAPVLDCQGRVVAVVSTLITQNLNLPTGPVRVSTPWQVPNVLSIPAAVLKDYALAE